MPPSDPTNLSQRGSTRLTIVVVEDEPDIADLLALYLRRDGWEVTICDNAQRAIDTIRSLQPDFVVLDIGLKGEPDGLQLCQTIRTTSAVPILFLTARADEIDRVLGLELGADDYVTKPFSPREVLARIKAILRRTSTNNTEATEPVSFASVSIDLLRHEARRHGAVIELASQEFALLAFMVRNAGQALSRQQILAGAWEQGWIGDTRTVDVHIRQLRRKLGPDLPLATVRGVGYRLG